MPMVRILNTIGTTFSQQARPLLSAFDVDYRDVTQANLAATIVPYNAVLCGLGLTFDRQVLDAATNLKVIATATTGLDHIDVSYAAQRGIAVVSLRDDVDFLRTITGTAELAWGLLLSLTRCIPFAFDDVKNGRWDREKFRGHSLHGKTLGIVGAGRLGSMMAKYGYAFGMRVVFADPGVDALATPSEKCTFPELLQESDVVSIHVHLDGSTKHMFDTEQFSAMKSTAYLINTARGEIVNEAALIKALDAKRLAGYAADVLADELAFDVASVMGNPLVSYATSHKNCIVVPHIGGMTVESREATDLRIAHMLAEHVRS